MLYYTYADMHKIRRMIEGDDANRETLKVHMDNLYRVVAFCENKVRVCNHCRWVFKEEFGNSEVWNSPV